MKKRIGFDRRRMRIAYAFMLPSLLYLLVCQVYPLFESIRLSFTDYSLLKPDSGNFIGFDNFAKLLFGDNNFWPIVGRTVSWVIVPTILQYTAGLLIALLLSQKIIARGLWRGLLMIPWVTPTVISGLIWQWIYDGQYGLLNYYLGTNVIWLGDPKTAWGSVIFMALWKGLSYASIMMLAAVQGIPKDIYEVAELDGSTGLNRLFKITIPMIAPVLYTSIATSIVISWTGFEAIWVLTNGGPGFATSTLPTYIYTKSFSFYFFGEGSAVAVLSMLFMLIFVLIYLKLFRKKGEV